MTAQHGETSTYVTPEIRAAAGIWVEGETSFPVCESDIRRWAIAVYWPEIPPRLFWDADHAAGTRWRGIVAPEEFNPFAWPIEDRSAQPSPGATPGQEAAPGQNLMNGGTADEFHARIRPGDVIRSRTRISHWDERQTRLGLTLFTYTETEWRNQRDELVRRRVGTQIQY